MLGKLEPQPRIIMATLTVFAWMAQPKPNVAIYAMLTSEKLLRRRAASRGKVGSVLDLACSVVMPWRLAACA